MRQKYGLYIIALLVTANFYAWQEVFLLQRGGLLAVDFLDVGQGDSAFIETPQHHQVLIDGGPDATVLDRLQTLMPAGDRTIDLVMLSHPEKDHMAGLLQVLQRYKIGYILWTGVKRDTPEHTQWTQALKQQENMGAKIVIVQAGQEIKMGKVLMDILSPKNNMAGIELKDSNDSCAVVKIIYGNESFLFTGDISVKGEAQLLDANVQTAVLKVAHHGSKYSTSEDFLQAAHPQMAVISNGKDNSYGHPAPEVLQRLDKFGIQTLRTDTMGSIKMLSNGYIINIEQ